MATAMERQDKVRHTNEVIEMARRIFESYIVEERSLAMGEVENEKDRIITECFEYAERFSKFAQHYHEANIKQ